MVNIHTNFKYILFSKVVYFFQTKAWILGAGIWQDFGNTCGIEDYQNELGILVFLINVVGKCGGQMDKFGKFGVQINGWEIWEVMNYDWIRLNIGCKRIGLVQAGYS